MSPPARARPVWAPHQLTDSNTKTKFWKYFSAWYSKILKETLNYADKDEELKGNHIVDQKKMFEKEIYKYLDKFGDEICVDVDPVSACMNILDEVKRLRQQGIIPSSNVHQDYKGFEFKVKEKPIDTTKMQNYYKTILQRETPEIKLQNESDEEN